MRLLKPTEFEAAHGDPMRQSAQAVRFLEGAIQRINYETRELTVIADGGIWRLELAADSLLWLNGRRAILRCFQPLDRARVFFQAGDSGFVVEALYVWTDER